jgi:hypothetical protein
VSGGLTNGTTGGNEDDEWQQETEASSSTPITKNLVSSNEVLPQPLLDCGQGKINPNKKDYGICPATGRGTEGDGGDVGSGLDGGPDGVANDGDEESMEIKDNSKESMATRKDEDSMAGALHPINKRERIRPSNTPFQINGVQLHSSESTPPPNSASPPSGEQQLVNWDSTSPRCDVHARA